MTTAIVPLTEAHLDGLHHALDTVAREHAYLAFLEAPPVEEARAFFRHMIEQKLCHFVAVQAGKVLGWCDILPAVGQARSHVGILGMGVMQHARRQGIGRLLLQSALEQASQHGFSRIELRVRTDNAVAIAMYTKAGFRIEGTHAHDYSVDGRFYETYSMALLPRQVE